MDCPTGQIVGLGEILWDMLPAGKQLGGAPFNFTFHCHQLGHPSVMVSRVGKDALGQAIWERFRGAQLTLQFIQVDDTHPTGKVKVAVDANGQPSFDIVADVAYDYLAWDADLEKLFGSARAVCFGTLGQRHPVARDTIRKALATAASALIVYDINLRQPYYNREVIESSLHASSWAKLNEDELTVLRSLLDLRGETVQSALADLRNRYSLELVALTRGANGCLVQTGREEVDLPGIPVKVVDTIGAGDAFTAGLVAMTLEGKSLAQSANFANRLAAKVAGSAGGTPSLGKLP